MEYSNIEQKAETLQHSVYIDTEKSIEEVLETVDKELDGPGQLLGYPSMNQKLRTEHDIKVPRDVIHNDMRYLDATNRKASKKRKKKKELFVSDGLDWVYFFDGHDKLRMFLYLLFSRETYLQGK